MLALLDQPALPAQPNPALSSSLDLKRLALVGLGAGGGATAFTVGSLPHVRGAVNLVEPHHIEDHNLNRYVFADAQDTRLRRPKAEAVETFLARHSGLQIVCLPKAFTEAARELKPGDYRYVALAVHTREARCELQYETPMVLWDAVATQDGEFRIWRHVLGTTECMFCKHPPGESDPERQKGAQLAELLGLDAETWLKKIRNNEVFAPGEVAAIAESLAGLQVTFNLPAAGQRFSDWEADHCGRLQLPEADEEIRIPFAPVMAGILIAGEIIKEHCFPQAALDSYYWNTLMGRFMLRNQPQHCLPRADCTFCHDSLYLKQYEKRRNASPLEPP